MGGVPAPVLPTPPWGLRGLKGTLPEGVKVPWAPPGLIGAMTGVRGKMPPLAMLGLEGP